MAPTVSIRVDGTEIEVEPGTSLAAALINAGVTRFRVSADGSPRGPICAMGVCFECRVTIDGERHRRSCMVVCRPGMEIVTGG